MKYSIGYQLPDKYDSISAIVEDYHDAVSEVYFAWPGEASGRIPLGMIEDGGVDKCRSIMEEELGAITKQGIRSVLLLNANCYGENAISKELRQHVEQLVSKLLVRFQLAAVTTTSPFLAHCIKIAYPGLEVRASVNMRIGTIKGMEYIADCFDGYYIQREYNRDFDRIRELSNWCKNNGKGLHLLANSGCLNFCSNQSFHDNLVAHEAEIVKKDNVERRHPSPCWEFMKEQEHWKYFLQNSWIRPEDIHYYEPYFQTVKLATRMHANPRKVLAAYVRQRFPGNLLDLTEPGFSSLLKGIIFDNERFPVDWFQHVTTCDKKCHTCNYCQTVLNQITIVEEELDTAFLQ